VSLLGGEDSGRNLNKLEKADILELAVEQLQMLQKPNVAVGVWSRFQYRFSCDRVLFSFNG